MKGAEAGHDDRNGASDARNATVLATDSRDREVDGALCASLLRRFRRGWGPQADPPRHVEKRRLSDLFERRFLIPFCSALIVVEVFAALFLAAGTYGLIVPLHKPNTTDFVSFYAAGTLAIAGTPERAYDQAEHYAAEQRATEIGIDYNFFYYPPVFLLYCAALARFPYLVSFLIFELMTIIFYLLVTRRILDEQGWAALLPVISFPIVFWNFGFGQNAFLTAALFGAGTLYIDRRPLSAGLLLGALCYKPQFGLLIPIALAAGRQWRAFGAAFASAAVLCLMSLAAFGWETWRDFILALSASSAVYATGRIPFSGYINAFGAVRQLGGSQTIAYLVQAGIALAAAIAVARVWRRNVPLPFRAATLASASLLAAPHAMFYDLLLGAVAALWLLRGGGQGRLLYGEKVALAGLFLLCLTPRSLAESSGLPVGPMIAATLAVLVGMEVFRHRAPPARTPAPNKRPVRWQANDDGASLPGGVLG